MAFLVGSAEAPAHFQTGVFAWSSCTGKRVDPVNLVFYKYGNTDRIASQVRTHLGWVNGQGTTLYFKTHGTCGPHHGQRASDGPVASRFHVRFHMNYHAADRIGTTSAASAHHEDLIIAEGCHAVDENGSQGSGFDQGRRKIRQAFQAAGHAWSVVNWGNTRNFKQCDGDYAGSDGRVVFIRIHSANH